MTEYDEDGFVRNLPQLLQQRRLHGCSYYDNANGTKEFIDNILFCFHLSAEENDNMQLLLLWQYMKRKERGLSISPFINMVDVTRDAREMFSLRIEF